MPCSDNGHAMMPCSDNGNAMMPCVIMVQLHRGRFVFVHLYSHFSMNPMIFLRSKIISKITIFGDLGAVGPHFKAITVKFGVKVGTSDSLPRPNFGKKSLKGIYPFGANLNSKLPIFAIFGAVRPHF